MSAEASIAGAEWLDAADLQRLLATLSADGEAARIAGGAVRNALLKAPVSDVDIATTNRPEATVRKAEAAGFKAVPTGIAHGTITVVAHGKPYEVTTLRADVDTDGRRARVVFGRDWGQDAERRDFTINALYAEADGTVIDLVGGLDDIRHRNLRFIGDPEQRIREDYLRILRFFRFFAWYGHGRPDAAGLKACARLKEGLDRLSAERVWGELKKLLGAPDPARALLWMRQTSVLTRILPETEKWGIDAIPGLIAAEQGRAWPVDPLLRLAAMLPPDPARLAGLSARLRLSKAEADRLHFWAKTGPVQPETGAADWRRRLYRDNRQGLIDHARLALAGAAAQDHASQKTKSLDGLLADAASWRRPRFPLRGSDLAGLGLKPGPRVGKLLARLEEEWLDSGFTLDRDALLRRAAKSLGSP